MQFGLVMVSPGGGGVLWISGGGDDRMGEKSKPSKNPQGFQQNPKTSLDQKLTPKKFILPFSTQIFRLFWISKKDPYLKLATKKNSSEIFLPPKISGIKNFKPPKNPSISPVTWNPEYPPPLGWYAKECLATSNYGWIQPDSTTSNTSVVLLLIVPRLIKPCSATPCFYSAGYNINTFNN